MSNLTPTLSGISHFYGQMHSFYQYISPYLEYFIAESLKLFGCELSEDGE